MFVKVIKDQAMKSHNGGRQQEEMCVEVKKRLLCCGANKNLRQDSVPCKQGPPLQQAITTYDFCCECIRLLKIRENRGKLSLLRLSLPCWSSFLVSRHRQRADILAGISWNLLLRSSFKEKETRKMPACWSAPTSKNAYWLSVFSVLITFACFIAGILLYLVRSD